ncbi:MAG: cytochrome c [Woeseiaceae bacterium]|jgi:cytochrome c556|nr:cytochrome c [Woeseiaceae bacterium]|tara:strand:- start:234 stop:716 length:483 start_codon:yes stop_codon:yes gene_type:complete
MKKSFITAVVALAVAAPAYFAFAADDFAFKSQIEGRQAFMQVYRFNLSILGGMAKGDVEYDADLAAASANNLLAASKMSNGAMWPMGSHTEAAGLADVTAAKEAIWSTYPDISDKGKDLTEALTAMAAVAGDGLESLRSNMGAVGNGCKGCHESYRLSRD